MSKLTQVVYPDLPDYTVLIQDRPQNNAEAKAKAKADVERLIRKINKANGGDKK